MLDTFRFSVISPKTHCEMQNYLVCCSPSIFLQFFHLISYDTMNFQSLRKFRGKIKNGGYMRQIGGLCGTGYIQCHT